MVKTLASLVVAGSLLAIMSTEASAWYCRATSSTGAWGWGSSYSLRQARRIALYQCAIRTPRGYYCRIRYCR